VQTPHGEEGYFLRLQNAHDTMEAKRRNRHGYLPKLGYVLSSEYIVIRQKD
jgi:hypothetical protein